MGQDWISWNGNITHKVNTFYSPKNEDELVQAVKESHSVRITGNRQSSADIIAGTDDLISLEHYNSKVSIDSSRYEITVQAGMVLADLLDLVDQQQWTIPALPDINTITVGGALATGTHGTGREALILSGYMVKCRVVLASGEIAEYDETNPELEAIRVSLGVLGIFSTVTFRCEPRWNLQLEERPMRDEKWLSTYREMLKNNKFLRILWLPHTDFGYVITGNEADTPLEKARIPWYVKYRRALSAKLYKRTVNNPRFTVFANKVIQKLFFNHRQTNFGSLYDATVTKSRGSTLELAEWTVALDRFDNLFSDLKMALNSLDNEAYAHIPMDIRFICADKSWLSYAYERDCVTIGCVSRVAEHADSYEAFNVIEDVFRKHEARPHWAKRHKMAGYELEEIYPKWESFIELREKLDPTGKFLNEYLKKVFTR